MRLIDADALLEGREDHEMISAHLIWNSPTIDAVPVIQASEQIHRQEYSMHKIGFTAQCAMQEYHDWLTERIEDA